MPASLLWIVKGGPVMVPLLVSSVLALAVVLERSWFWWRRRERGDADRVLGAVRRQQWDEALGVADASRSPVARVLAAGIRHRNPAPALAMETAAREEVVGSTGICRSSTPSSRSLHCSAFSGPLRA